MATADWAKKFYSTTKDYFDAAYGQISNRQVWNRVFELHPRLSEFFETGKSKAQLTSLERSFVEYIIQSELVKPYDGNPYDEMEYSYPPLDPGEYPELPWPSEPDVPPIEQICDIESDSCWCPGRVEKDLIIHGTYPIWRLDVIYAPMGIRSPAIVITSGWGTNTLIGKIQGRSNTEGFITISCLMESINGLQCYSSLNLFKCDDEDCVPECETLTC